MYWKFSYNKAFDVLHLLVRLLSKIDPYAGTEKGKTCKAVSTSSLSTPL